MSHVVKNDQLAKNDQVVKNDQAVKNDQVIKTDPIIFLSGQQLPPLFFFQPPTTQPIRIQEDGKNSPTTTKDGAAVESNFCDRKFRKR